MQNSTEIAGIDENKFQVGVHLETLSNNFSNYVRYKGEISRRPWIFDFRFDVVQDHGILGWTFSAAISEMLSNFMFPNNVIALLCHRRRQDLVGRMYSEGGAKLVCVQAMDNWKQVPSH